jgi:hypothetical protein
MPTEDSFTALGKGNGFTFCLNKIDVSDRGDGQPYDYWVTLGGFKKTDGGSPSQEQIDESLRVAMALFWNLDGWTGRLLSDSFLEDEITSLSMKNDDWTRGLDEFEARKNTFDDIIDPEFEPHDRVCYRSFLATKYLSDDPDSGDIYDYISIGSYHPPIIRMYDGDDQDESNFVGYGFKRIESVFGYEAFHITFSSYYNGSPASPTQTDEDIAYTEIPTNVTGLNLPCVGYIEQNLAFEIPADFDIYSWVDLTFSSSNEYEAFEFRIDSLDFYTYT